MDARRGDAARPRSRERGRQGNAIDSQLALRRPYLQIRLATQRPKMTSRSKTQLFIAILIMPLLSANTCKADNPVHKWTGAVCGYGLACKADCVVYGIPGLGQEQCDEHCLLPAFKGVVAHKACLVTPKDPLYCNDDC